MRALKKHKILVINIFPLESFNGTIELKFKNPLLFLHFLIYSFLYYLSEPVPSAFISVFSFSTYSLPFFLFVITTAFNYVNEYIYFKKNALNSLLLKTLSLQEDLRKKKGNPLNCKILAISIISNHHRISNNLNDFIAENKHIFSFLHFFFSQTLSLTLFLPAPPSFVHIHTYMHTYMYTATFFL